MPLVLKIQDPLYTIMSVVQPNLPRWSRRRDAGWREGGNGLSCGVDIRTESVQASTSSRLTCNTLKTEFK